MTCDMTVKGSWERAAGVTVVGVWDMGCFQLIHVPWPFLDSTPDVPSPSCDPLLLGLSDFLTLLIQHNAARNRHVQIQSHVVPHRQGVSLHQGSVTYQELFLK